MPEQPFQSDSEPGVDTAHLLLIVVGAHLRAEQADRPLAYRLRDAVDSWVAKHERLLTTPIRPLVCSDIWYLNHNVLHARPTISIGGPGVNALSSHFARSIENKVSDDPQVVLQIDPEFTDLRISIWGTDHDLTGKGVSVFISEYLDAFLRAVATQVEPES